MSTKKDEINLKIDVENKNKKLLWLMSKVQNNLDYQTMDPDQKGIADQAYKAAVYAGSHLTLSTSRGGSIEEMLIFSKILEDVGLLNSSMEDFWNCSKTFNEDTTESAFNTKKLKPN